MSVLGHIAVLFVVSLCSDFKSPLSPFFGFTTVFVIICVSFSCFTGEVEDPFVDGHMFIILN